MPASLEQAQIIVPVSNWQVQKKIRKLPITDAKGDIKKSAINTGSRSQAKGLT